jgi:hypothetical protein
MKKKSGGKKATRKPKERDLSPLERGSRRVKGGRLGQRTKRI